MNFDEGRASHAPLAQGIRERLLAVRAFGLFAEVDDEAATLLTEHARLVSFDRGAHISGVEGTVATVHLILEGNIRLGDEAGRHIELGPGSPVGLLAILSADLTGPESVATTPVRTLAIPADVFLAALEDNFSLWRSALRLVTTSLIYVRGDLPNRDASSPADPHDDFRPRLLVERALEISETGIFAGANIDAVFDAARIMREVQLPVGHVLWRHGERSTASVRVVSGSIRCTNAAGESMLAGPGYFLGMLAAAARRPHPFTAQAETVVRAYEVHFEDWLVIFEAHPELAMPLLANLATTLSNIIGARLELTKK